MEGARLWKLEPGRQHETRLEAMHRRRVTIQKDLETMIPRKVQVEDRPPLTHDTENPVQNQHDPEEVNLMVQHLWASLELLVDRIFAAANASGIGPKKDEPVKARWVQAYFPFTSPSFELEIFWKGEWLELLGSGIVNQPILNNAGLNDHVGWAWGIGVERLAMLLFDIPDIRLFWSKDKRFLDQFHEGHVRKFEPFSKYPPSARDIAFWLPNAPPPASPVGAESKSGVAAAAGGDATKASPSDKQPAAFHENDIMEIVRDVAGSIVEDVKLLEEFVHPKTGRKSLCYRIVYRSLERTLTNEEVTELHKKVEGKLTENLGVEVRG
jgi:phenylalanyl-tRNA synthetase alpha chain